MLALCLMLLMTDHAQNFASIIGRSPVYTQKSLYMYMKISVYCPFQ